MNAKTLKSKTSKLRRLSETMPSGMKVSMYADVIMESTDILKETLTPEEELIFEGYRESFIDYLKLKSIKMMSFLTEDFSEEDHDKLIADNVIKTKDIRDRLFKKISHDSEKVELFKLISRLDKRILNDSNRASKRSRSVLDSMPDIVKDIIEGKISSENISGLGVIRVKRRRRKDDNDNSQKDE